MGRKITRIRKDFSRAVAIDGVTHVLTFGREGMTIRRLKARQRTAIPVTWRELASRPLLAACVKANCGASKPAVRSAAV